MDRTLEAFAAILAIFQSGHTYLPIAEDLPDERKRNLVADSNAKATFASVGLTSPFEEESGSKLIATDSKEVTSALETISDEFRTLAANSAGGGYLLYTSGSTGKPKGVRISNGNLSAYIEGYANVILQHSTKVSRLGGTGKQLNLASRAFDPHVSQMFLSWRLGFCATTGPRSLFLEDLPRAINALQLTHVGSLPSVLDQNGMTPQDVPSLAVLAVGGEKITKHVLDTWASNEEISVFNLYGPTETTIGCTLSVVTSKSGPKNIGYPLGNSTALVVQPGTLNIVKLGQTGELCMAGDLVAQGYLRPQETTGFCTLADGTPAYRTGDVVQMLEDRSIEFLGRRDEQIKIRGQRLELSEVNECVLSAPLSTSISCTTVYTKHPQLPAPRLFTFVCEKGSSEPSGGQAEMHFISGGEKFQSILQHCQQRVPAFMVPTLLFVDAIPLLPSGKVNVKQAIAAFCAVSFSDATKADAAQASNKARELNEEEYSIVACIKEVVNCQEFDFTLNSEVSMFELGVDSLNAVKLSLKLRGLGYEASVASMLQNDTLSKLASLPRVTTEVQSSTPSFDQETFEKDNRRYLASVRTKKPSESSVESILPAMPLQQALVALSMAQDSGAPLYIHHLAYQLEDTLSMRKLQAAWQQEIEREEILRSCFMEGRDGYIIQAVLKSDHLPIALRVEEAMKGDDDSYLSDWQTDRQSIGQDIVANIAAIPPYRVRLIDRTKASLPPLMFISMHHSVYDGESFNLLLEDLHQSVQGRGVSPRPRSIGLLQHVANQDETSAREFWSDYLRSFEPVTLPKGGDRKENDVRRLELDLPPSSYAALKTSASRRKTTLPTLFQTAFALVMAKNYSQNDVVIGNVMSGRSVQVEGVDKMLIPCLTTMPLRINMQKLDSVHDVVKETKRSLTRMWPFQHSSLAKIQRWAGSEDALFDVLFSFRSIQRDAEEARRKMFKNLSSNLATDYPLAFNVEVDTDEETIKATLAYATSRLSNDNAVAMKEQLQLLLGQLASDDDVLLSDLGITSDATNGHRSGRGQLAGGQKERSGDVETWDDDSPWEAEEEQIRTALAQTLSIENEEEITKSQTFYLLGLDSILAIRFTRLLREAGLDVHTAQILQSRCIGALWASIKSHQQETEDDRHDGGVSKGQKRERGEQDDSTEKDMIEDHRHFYTPLGDDDALVTVYSCTPLQSGMLSQTETNRMSSYDQKHRIELNKDVDMVEFKRAWESVVEAHDILRTTFHLTENLQRPWVGVVHCRPRLQWHEDSETREAERSNETVPPVSVSVKERRVTFRLHHALYDGVSLPIMFASLRRAYQCQESRKVSPIVPPFYTAARFIVQSQEKDNAFWKELLEGYAYASLPRADSARVAGRSRWRASKTLSMSTECIERKCQSIELTIQSVALLAFAKMLAVKMQRRDVVFGQVISGRSLPLEGATEIIGPLFNTLPFRVKLNSSVESNLEAARKIQALSELAHDHQSASLREVQNDWRKEEGTSAARVLDCLFVFHREGAASASEDSRSLWNAVRAEEDQDQDHDEEYDINFSIVRKEGTICLSVNATTRVVEDEVQLQEMTALFNDIFCDVICQPSRPTLAFPSGLDRTPLTVEKSTRRPSTREGSKRPCQGAEVVLRDEFCKLFKTSSEQGVGPSTNLLITGVDSISAIRLARNTSKAGVKMTVADILQGQTIEEICRLATKVVAPPDDRVDDVAWTSPEQVTAILAKLDLKKGDAQDVLPCLPGQQHYLDSWMSAGRRFVDAPWIYRADDVDEDRLWRAWESLRNRHGLLRSCFVAVDQSSTFQVILQPRSTPKGWKKIVVSSDTSLEEATRAWITQSSDAPTDLCSPPVHLCLLLKGKQAAVVTRFHHAVYDGQSVHMLKEDLEDLYHERVPSSTVNFSAFVRHTLALQDEDRARQRWKAHLQDVEPTFLSASEHDVAGSEKTAFGPQVLVKLPNIIRDTAKLEEQCRRKGASLQLVVMLAFARLLAKSTEAKTKPLFGFYTACRTASFPDLSKLAGPTINVLPIAIATKASLSVSIDALRNELSDRIAYEQTSLRDITTWINGGQTSLFNCFLNLLWSEESSSSSDAETVCTSASKETLLQPWSLSKPTDYFTTQAAKPSSETSLGPLDVNYLAKNNVYVDLSHRSGSFHLGIRCSAFEHNDEWIAQFGRNFAQEICGVVDELSSLQ
ncbi:hypothetical protein CBS101457_003402 [Exobasidium rhododendri]|nr:hypothetical protein CBS101457_003402 [Exobasidium rhododendri]